MSVGFWWKRRGVTVSRPARRLICVARRRLPHLGFGYGTVQRFLVRHGMTRKKKTGHSSEQERADVLARRQDWLDSQPRLDPARLVFIDETWV